MALLIRVLLRNPGSSSIAIMTLALGIGLTSAVFTIVSAVLLRPLPFHDPHRLVAVIAVPNETGGLHSIPNASFADLQRLPAVAAAGTYLTYPPVTLSGAGDPVKLTAAFVSADFQHMLGVLPMLGPGFTRGDEALCSRRYPKRARCAAWACKRASTATFVAFSRR
jgi:putative ABC transport system permease protein